MKRAKAENAIIYWADETGVSNCEIVERGFSPKGHPPVLPVETKRQRVNMISAISSQGSVRFMVYQDAMNQQLTRDSCPIPRKIFPTKSSHLCADYSIIPLLFPVSSSNLYFPIFARISNTYVYPDTSVIQKLYPVFPLAFQQTQELLGSLGENLILFPHDTKPSLQGGR